PRNFFTQRSVHPFKLWAAHFSKKMLWETVLDDLLRSLPTLNTPAHFPRAGLFRCVETDLVFLVRMATSIEYKYSFWERHLASGIPPVWMEVGPVFDIHAPPGTVEAIHIPHFLCLGGTVQNTFWMQIAHIVDGNLLLEKPTRVKPFHAVLQDPSFSPMGVIVLSDILPFIPVHSLVLLYQVLSAADITFHLYLIPNHRGLEKVSVPLILVNNSELKFIYLSLDRRQLFTEIYTKDMEEGMQLTLTKVVQEGKRDCRPLWDTLLRAGRESRMQVYVTGSDRLGGCPNVQSPGLGREHGADMLRCRCSDIKLCVSHPPVFNSYSPFSCLSSR
uniref:FIIND domain-containing protein n=1 Tax=Cairina moschata TaxID=8855 RepID=A0A8C3CRP6_CAIMO